MWRRFCQLHLIVMVTTGTALFRGCSNGLPEVLYSVITLFLSASAMFGKRRLTTDTSWSLDIWHVLSAIKRKLTRSVLGKTHWTVTKPGHLARPNRVISIRISHHSSRRLQRSLIGNNIFLPQWNEMSRGHRWVLWLHRLVMGTRSLN